MVLNNLSSLTYRRIKHSQIVSGVKWYNFWLSTFTWDFINFLIPALLTVCMYAIADVKNLAGALVFHNDYLFKQLNSAVLMTLQRFHVYGWGLSILCYHY